MELSVGSVSLSTLMNETLTSRTALVHISRATSVSRVSASGRRHFPSSERSSFVHGGRGHLSWSNFPEDIVGLGCRLCIKGQKKSSTLHNSRWNASASGEFTGTSFEATASSARDDLKDEDPVMYFIKEGDTLTAIAKRYNTTISRLAVDNGIDNVDILLPGEKLVIHFPSERTRQIPFRAKSEISAATSKMLAKAPAKLVKELNTATTSGYDTAPTYSHVGGFSPIPSGIMAQVIIPLLLIAPVVGFCVRCAVDYIQERIQKEIEAKHAELESYRSRRRPKVNRWQGILDEDRMEALGREEAAAASAALDDYRSNDEQQIPTGYASIRAMNEDSVANESEEEHKHRHMKDYEDIRKSYAELETTYKKFLLDSGLSRSGYWRGSVTQLQEEHQ